MPTKKRKPGRPPSKEGARTNRVQVLLHDHEKATIQKAAGPSLSKYLRNAGLEKAAKSVTKPSKKKKP